MHSSPVRSWRELLLALPILLSTGVFMILSTPIFFMFLNNHLSQQRINAHIQQVESETFDLTSLSRSVHASFLSSLTATKKVFAPFAEGLGIQSRVVLADLQRRSSTLSPPERRSLTDIVRRTDRYFFLLTQEVSGPSGGPSAALSNQYRDLTFKISAFSFRLDRHLKGDILTIGRLYKTRSLLVSIQTGLTLLYAGVVLLLSTSRRHTRQVLLDFAAEDSEEMIALTDLEGTILFANRQFRDFFLRSESRWEGQLLSTVLRERPSFGPIATAWESFRKKPGAAHKEPFPIRDPKNPDISWLMVQMTPTRPGRRSRFLEWKGVDFSRLKNAEMALEAQGEWLRTTLASIGDGVIATDISGKITFLNNVAERLTGYLAQEAIGRPVDEIFRIINEKSGESVNMPIERVLKEDIVVGLANHTALISRDGRTISISDSAAPIHSRDGLLTGVVMVFQENTERRRAQEMIWNLTYRDTLTHLPNQSLFFDRLATLIPWARGNGRLLSVVMVDIDLFKRINDSLGHGAGNELLKAFSHRFSKHLSPNDTLARIGGDEFLVMLTECRSEKDVVHTCETLLKSLDDPFEIAGQEITLSASLGVAIFPRDGEEADLLIKNADTALNQAKEAGRNRFIFYEKTMSTLTLRDLQMEQGLKQALMRGEFFLEYQPQIDTQSGRIVGAEALVRWNSPESGRTMPGDFIPLAERTGLIIPLGDIVLQMALEQAKKWWTDGTRITISVNTSYQHFIRAGFVNNVLSILHKVGIPPEALLLEITESMVIKDSERFFSVVEELHLQGVKISIDDFGTGATALSYLTNFPISEVKIDRSLVTNLFSDLKRSELVRTIIGLGKRLEFTTIAEGVERSEEWEYLRRHQCDRIQGFLVSYPLSPQSLESLFSQRFLQKEGEAPSWSID